MHIVFQFPIVDLRDVVPNENGRIDKPNWSAPKLSKQPFISGFGKVKSRNQGGSLDFPGEANFCDAHSAIKFTDIQHQGFSEGLKVRTSIFNSYRRFYSNGHFLGKLEVGMVDNLEKIISNPSNLESNVKIETILKHYANLEVKVADETVKLCKAGPLLAKKYQTETTFRKKNKGINRDYVQSGELSILLVCKDHGFLKLPDRSFCLEKIALPEDGGILELYGYKLKQDGYAIKTWILKTPPGFSSKPKNVRAVLRDLRMNLLRIHLEKETIRILLNAINDKQIELEKGSKQADKVNSYFKNSAEKLFRKTRFEIDQKNLLNFSLQSEEVVDRGSFNSLKEEITYFQDEFIMANLDRMVDSMAKKIVLFICSNPKEKNFIGFDEEFESLRENCRTGTDQHHFDPQIKLAVKKNKFSEILDEFKPQFLHISLHSSLKEGLYFQDKNRNPLPMSVKEFKEIIALYSSRNPLDLVIISACNSRKHARAIKANCNYVVGTNTVFPVPGALAYAHEFYTLFFNGKSADIESCHGKAIDALKSLKIEDQPYGKKHKKMPVYKIPILIQKTKNYV